MINTRLTFGYFHLCDCLPLVHSNEPLSFFPSAAQVNNELVAIIAEGFQDFLQARKREAARGKQEGGDDDLLLIEGGQ